MFFEKDNLSFKFLSATDLNQKNVKTVNSKRDFCMLSFRTRADTFLKTKHQTLHLFDNTVTFIPNALDYTREAKIDELIAIHFTLENYETNKIQFFVSKNPDKLKRAFETLLLVWQKKEIGYQYKCTSLLYEIFLDCYEQNHEKKAKSSKIQSSINFLFKNYKKEITIREIAEQSFMSEVYFRKLFQREFGVSPQKYIVQLRIQNAIELMQTGYYSLKEIAAASGYRDYKYFLTEFKRIKGVTPTKYLSELN